MKKEGLESLFTTIEMPLIYVLAEMEATGVTLDTVALKQSSGELTASMNKLEQEVYELAGTVLAFARALGEYGATSMIAGYTPGKTATIATTVYQLWRTNDEAGAMRWVLVDIVISAVVLLAVNLLEKKQKAGGRA